MEGALESGRFAPFLRAANPPVPAGRHFPLRSSRRVLKLVLIESDKPKVLSRGRGACATGSEPRVVA